MSSASTTSTNRSYPTPSTDQSVVDDAEDNAPRLLMVMSRGRHYAIPVTQVREVIRPDQIIRVPGAPPSVWGVANVRGAVVTVLDLAALLGHARGASWGSVVLIEQGPRCIGLAVDAVKDVQRADESGQVPLDARAGDDVIVPLDALALCVRHLHSTQETTS